MLQKYSVCLPVVGYVNLSVQAESEEEAISKALAYTDENEFEPDAFYAVKSFDDASYCDVSSEALAELDK